MTSLSNIKPELTRLITETVRIVKIPYYTGFSETQEGINLDTVVDIALGPGMRPTANILLAKLQSDGVGYFYCPRRSDGAKGSFIHRHKPGHKPRQKGVCNFPDDSSPSGICGRRLVPEDTKMHEFAEAIGYLEVTKGKFGPGKFGAVSKFLTDQQKTSTSSMYPDYNRAHRGLRLWALLERHADMLLPLLWLISEGHYDSSSWIEDVLSIFRKNLASRNYLAIPSMPAALRRDQSVLDRHVQEAIQDFGVNNSSGNLSLKTQRGYVERTRRYLDDLALIASSNTNQQERKLTTTGISLVQSLQKLGYLTSELHTWFDPGFEAIHDVFSLTQSQYEKSFQNPVLCSTYESLISSTLLPDTECKAWEDRSGELEAQLPTIINSISDVGGSARSDQVRLALFLQLLATSTPLHLDNKPDPSKEDWTPNEHAIATISLSNPNLYTVGTVRVSRRIWSIRSNRRGVGAG